MHVRTWLYSCTVHASIGTSQIINVYDNIVLQSDHDADTNGYMCLIALLRVNNLATLAMIAH